MMDSKSDKSAFNMGVATLERINIILKEIKEYSEANMYQRWARSLITLYKELRPFTRKQIRVREQIDTKMEFARIIDRKMNFNDKMVNNKQMENNLDEIELLLRDIIMEYDLLMPRQDDPRFAVLQR